MKTARFASFSLGMGITIAATSAFADPPQQYGGQYGGHVHDETCHHDQEPQDVRTYYPEQQGDWRADGWLERYDTNNDYSVSFAEYRRFEIMSCERAFQRSDVNGDGMLTERERGDHRWSECDAIDVVIRSPQRVRWGWGYNRYRRGYSRRGVSWQQFRSVATDMIERDFRQADLDRSGVLSKFELISFKRSENEAQRDGRVFDRGRYGRGV